MIEVESSVQRRITDFFAELGASRVAIPRETLSRLLRIAFPSPQIRALASPKINFPPERPS